MRIGQLRHLLGAVKDSQLSDHFNSSYRNELASGDDDRPIQLKRIGDVAALMKAVEIMPQHIRENSGIVDLDIWLPTSPETQLPQPVPRQMPSSISSGRRPIGFTTTMHSRLTRQTTDLDGNQIEQFRYQSLMDSGLAGDLTLEQFQEAQDVFGMAVSNQPPAQAIVLDNIDHNDDLLRTGRTRLSETLLAGRIDLLTITQTLTRLGAIFSCSDTIQVYGERLQRDSVVIGVGVKTLFIPILTGNNWSLVVLETDSKTMVLYDSIPRRSSRVFQTVTAALSINMDIWETRRIARCTVQTENDSSALFLLLNTVAYFCGFEDPVQMYNGNDLPALRKWLTLAIIKNRVEMNGRVYGP